MLLVMIKRRFWTSFKVGWTSILQPFLFYCQPFVSDILALGPTPLSCLGAMGTGCSGMLGPGV